MPQVFCLLNKRIKFRKNQAFFGIIISKIIPSYDSDKAYSKASSPFLFAAINQQYFPNNEVVYVTPSEQIDETEEICVVDYLIPRSNERIFDCTKIRCFGEDNFTIKIGGTTYEVSTHFNPKGRQKKKLQRCSVDYRLKMKRKTPSQIP